VILFVEPRNDASLAVTSSIATVSRILQEEFSRRVVVGRFKEKFQKKNFPPELTSFLDLTSSFRSDGNFDKTLCP
jgi:hypothetical protein